MKHLKQLLLGAVLLEGGILGFVGFLIACTQKVVPGAISTVLGCVHGAKDWIFVLGFAAMAVVGLVVAVKSLNGRD